MRTNAQMVTYWRHRVAELEAMRPITAAEAMAEAEGLEASAAAHEQAVQDAECVPLESGRVSEGDSVAARGMRNNRALGDSRRAVWGESTRALQDRGRAESLRRIAGQSEGAALAESLADARAKLAYYEALS